MAYTREKPSIARSTDELRNTIPGWGVDVNPVDRPSFPKEAMQDTGAHWDFPERQQPRGPREKSTETGVLREFKGNVYRTRFGQHRADLKHLPLDAVLWAAPYAAIGCGLYLAAK